MNRSLPQLSALALAIACLLPVPAMAGGGVPEGFEELVQGQREQVEVRLFDRSAGIWPALIDLTSVQLERPEALLAALGLSGEAQAALAASLGQSLPRNSHLACPAGPRRSGCGHLQPLADPGSVQLIYDESAGVVHLFVAPQWLPVEGAAPARHHQPSARAENALIHQQTVNASGSDGSHNLTAQGHTVLGAFDRGHVAADWTFVAQRDRWQGTRTRLQTHSIYYRHDLGAEHHVQVGRMDRSTLVGDRGGDFALSMLPLDRMVGVRVGTTQAYLSDAAAEQGSPVTVLLGRNARVDVFDGDRLLETAYMEAGINRLDTRRLPSGSYVLSLRIYEDGVLTRTEQVPFSKSGAGFGSRPEWFVQSGRRSEPHRYRGEAVPVTQIGARLPMGAHAATTLGLAQVDDTAYGEARLDLRGRIGPMTLEGGLATLHGSDGTHGSEQRLSLRQGASLNVLRQKRHGATCQNRPAVYESLGCLDSTSVYVSAPIAGGSGHLGFTERQSRSLLFGGGGQPLPWALSPVPPRPDEPASQQVRQWQLSFNRSWFRGDHSVTLSSGLWHNTVARSSQRDRGIYASLAFARTQRTAVDSRARRVALDARLPQQRENDYGISLSETLRREGAGQHTELALQGRARPQGEQSVGFSVHADNRTGSHGLNVAWERGRHGEVFSYGLNHSSSLTLSRHGLHWGMAGAAGAGGDAALLFDVGRIDGLSGSAVDVQLHGRRRETLRSGQRLVLPVRGYNLQQAELLDSGHPADAVAIRVANPGPIAPVFLPPGKLMNVPVALETTFTYIGNAFDGAGASLDGARVLNVPRTSLGQDGGFLVESPEKLQALYLMRRDQLLSCPFERQDARSVAVLVGDIRCNPLALSQLPAPIRQQVHVQRLLRDHELPAAPQRVSAGDRP